MSTVGRSVHNSDKGDRIETGSSNQHPVNIIGCHQLARIVWLDATSIEDGDMVSPASNPLSHSAAELFDLNDVRAIIDLVSLTVPYITSREQLLRI